MRRAATILFILSAACPWLRAQMAMVNPQVPEASLSMERTRDLLLGRVTNWNDGSPVILVLVDDQSADLMLQKVIGRDRSRLIRGWKRLVYTGSGAMPLLASSLAEAAELVARHPGSIALIERALPGHLCRFLPLSEAAAH